MSASLVVGVPCLHYVRSMFFRNFWAIMHNSIPNNTTLRPAFTDCEPISDWIDSKGVRHDGARTQLVRAAKVAGARWLLFMDDDCLLPKGAIARMIAYHLPIVNGTVFLKTTPTFPVLFRKWGEGCWDDWYDEPAQLERIDSAGLSCTLIDMTVFEQISEPWFLGDTMWKDDKIISQNGEDTAFYAKCKNAGIEAYGDTGIICLHQDRLTAKLYPEQHLIERIRKAQRPAEAAGAEPLIALPDMPARGG